MDSVTEYIDRLKEQANEHKEITLGLAAIGAAYVVGHTFTRLRSFYKYFIRPSLNLKARYGDGWAIVTGASDGIGRAYAFELAKKGFNVGLIARNEEKLEKVAKEIQEKYKVQVKSVVFDFNTFYTEEKINELKGKLEVFDRVSLLINNVGILYNAKFNDLKDEQILSLINVNLVGLTIITKLLLPKLLDTKLRSGIINIGSGTTEYIYPGMNVYSSTKSFVNMFSASLSAEYSHVLDWMLATVAPVKSNMNPGLLFLSSYPESVAAHTLNTLGKETKTYGDWRCGLRWYLLARKVEQSIVRYIDLRNIQIAKEKSMAKKAN